MNGIHYIGKFHFREPVLVKAGMKSNVTSPWSIPPKYTVSWDVFSSLSEILLKSIHFCILIAGR